ncbi:pyroglutamyl-peptidase I [Caldalkalibacillus salinus]|uniref:pyroglutamyl-peptidase I n=1 Tax=Caldalkalibacillus salinus TaxID=2803787 RepID=UPI0019249260|nr:pyroglutamyl-peptidase I [Caldalkalibacillus salinus]
MSEKQILLTGFEPFLDHPINPTEEVVSALNGQQVGPYKVQGEVLPVVFDEAGKAITEMIRERQPDAIVSLGLAAGRVNVTPERIAINCRDGAVDNEGVAWKDAPIEQDGKAAYFSTLPIRKMVDRLVGAKYPAKISNTAGTYVCNNVMYQTLYTLEQEGRSHIPAGFIHIPANHELACHQPKYASWSTSDLISSIKLCLETIE